MTSIVEHAHAGRTDGLDAALARLLADWLPRQRWYGGKGARIDADGVDILLRLDLTPGRDPGLLMVVAQVRPEGRDPQRYQLFLGTRRSALPDRLSHAVLGVLPADRVPGAHGKAGGAQDGVHAYDALHDPELAGWLLSRLAAGEVIGPLRFHVLPGRRIEEDLRSLVLTGEQSNTSVVYGDQYISKFLRRCVPGVNPDLELSLALSDSGSRNIPAPIGWIDLDFDLAASDPERPHDGGPSPYDEPEPVTVAMISEFLPTATDGWRLAQASVRDLFAQSEGTDPRSAGGDFGPEARRLGEATARVHHDLATSLPTGRMEPEELARVAAGMIRHLHRAAERVTELEPHVPALERALGELAGLEHSIVTQRVHGDFHLGQVMRTVTGWVLLDFEGEPSRTLAERRAMAPAAKDVAGMARSFDYAGHHICGNRSAGVAWAKRNFEEFCTGYAEVSGHDPREQAVLLRCYEIDKAVYEAVYESANRPTWLPIPLAAVERLTAAAVSS